MPISLTLGHREVTIQVFILRSGITLTMWIADGMRKMAVFVDSIVIKRDTGRLLRS